MKTRSIIKKFIQALGVIAIALVLVGLGNWQLDRAGIVKELNAAAKVIDPKVYSLSELAEPTLALDSRNVNKQVSVSGFYIANFKAPLQSDKDGVVKDWEVALLQVDGVTPISGILVVRGLWSDRLLNPEVAMSTKIELVGSITHVTRDILDSMKEPGLNSSFYKFLFTEYKKNQYKMHFDL
jgi:cytochrome oxidase assembly protein ShyY1